MIHRTTQYFFFDVFFVLAFVGCWILVESVAAFVAEFYRHKKMLDRDASVARSRQAKLSLVIDDQLYQRWLDEYVESPLPWDDFISHKVTQFFSVARKKE